jgi:hypothetical protein
MYAAADIARELDEGLKQLFHAGLELSLQVQADAMAAEPAEKARLGLTFHRISRGVRQTAALRMRLAHEAERAGRETAAEVIKLDQRRLEKRKAHVKAAVECLIWTEAESPEAAERLDGDFEDLLEIETQDAETFEGEPLDEQIQRLAWVIGLERPSPLAGEGVGRSPDEGSHGDHHIASSAEPASPAQPLIRAASAAHLLPQGEKDDDDPLISDNYWRSSA